MKIRLKASQLITELILWICITFFLLFYIYDPEGSFVLQFIASLLITALTAIPAYIVTQKLVPFFLYKKRISRFIILLISSALTNSVITFILAGMLYLVLSGSSIFRNFTSISYIYSFIFIFNLIVMTISSAIRIIIDRFSVEQQLFETEKEKISTELAFLRAQINPHFLFNILNTIYFQINKENREARDSVEKLSEMLRYQLYECTSDRIDISKELAYIKNYVEVQRLRMEPGTDLQLHLPEKPGSFAIAPLLILPLVENAFKYLSNYKDPAQNKLHISIRVEADPVFTVNILNTYNHRDQTDFQYYSGGLGLKNLDRRLSLLYPGNYSMEKIKTQHTYETILSIRYAD